MINIIVKERIKKRLENMFGIGYLVKDIESIKNSNDASKQLDYILFAIFIIVMAFVGLIAIIIKNIF